MSKNKIVGPNETVSPGKISPLDFLERYVVNVSMSRSRF